MFGINSVITNILKIMWLKHVFLPSSDRGSLAGAGLVRFHVRDQLLSVVLQGILSISMVLLWTRMAGAAPAKPFPSQSEEEKGTFPLL